MKYPYSMPNSEWSGPDFAVARRLLGLTQIELADKLGYTRAGIARIEGSKSKVRLVAVLAVRHLYDQRELKDAS